MSFILLSLYIYAFVIFLPLFHIFLMKKSEGRYQQIQFEKFQEILKYNLAQWFNPVVALKALEVTLSQRIMLFNTYILFLQTESRVKSAVDFFEEQTYLLYKNQEYLKKQVLTALKNNVETLEYCQEELGYKSRLLKDKDVIFYRNLNNS